MDVIDILMAKMLSGGADPSAIKDAVEDYLDEHGVTVTETDPTVPAWAKAANPPVSSVNGETGVVVLDAEDVGALPEPLEIPLTESGGEYSTTATAEQIRAAKENSIFVFDGEARIKALFWLPWDEDLDMLIGMQMLNGTIMAVAATVTTNNIVITVEQTLIPTAISDLTNDSGFQTAAQVQATVNTAIGNIPDELPAVSASDNGKVLGVVNGAWAVKTDESGSTVTVDSALSDSSTNPVQNKVVNAAFVERDNLMQKCVLISDPNGANLWNPETRQTGLITTSGLVYTGGSYDNYSYNEINAINAGDVITFWELYGSPSRWVQKQIARVTAFDANGNAVISKGIGSAVDTYTVPDGITSIWLCSNVKGNYPLMALANATETPTEYIEYGSVSQYYVATEEFLPVENFVVNFPSDLYALVGYELNVYFENLVEDWTKYDWNVNCDKGMQLERGYRITPTADDVGNYTLSIKISNGKDSATVSTTLHVIAASANSGVTKTVMVLGDSTTNNGIAVTKLNENFSNDVMNITLVGTRGTAPNLHEGRSGWTFNSYFNPPNAGDIAADVENPWYNPTTQTFDANYYFTNTGVTKPDWLFINLGINDVFGFDKDSTLETAITNCKSLCDSMIASIKSASPSTKIGLCLTIPPNHSQDAFGKAYACGQTRDRYKRNNLLWVHSLIETYSNRTSDGIYIIPIYTNLDTVYNMGMETLPVNARNTDVTYQSPIGNGGVHPVSSGYWQIADVYTMFLKSQA